MEKSFGLIRPFAIDNGELEGLSSQEIFVLGYELATIDIALAGKKGINQMVHSANMDRITFECERQKRTFRFVWNSEDISEAWVQLIVSPRG